MLAVEQALAMAADTSEDTRLDRLAADGASVQVAASAFSAIKATAPTTAEPYTLTAEDVDVEL
ncbi:MAG: hypothetical protein K5695_03020 [Oscillospiraceae bacterium]|nr:hypothetical protein [Oscillospiraceae bacterium]